MPCGPGDTCACVCTVITVPGSSGDIEVECDVTGDDGKVDDGCRCECSISYDDGTDVVTGGMWLVNDGVLFINVTINGTEYHGICEGTVCDGENNFDCGGSVTCEDEDGNEITVTVDGEACTEDCPTDCSTCDDPITVTISSMSGNCPAVFCGGSPPCSCFDGIYTLNLINPCYWYGSGSCNGMPHDVVIDCFDRNWRLRVQGQCFAVCAQWNAPNTDGCPPTGTWTFDSSTSSCAGGTAIIS
jgi:hypothetical protein